MNGEPGRPPRCADDGFPSALSTRHRLEHETTGLFASRKFEDCLMIVLSPPIERLLREIAGDERLRDMAAPFREGLELSERAADDCWHTGEMMRAFGLIAEQRRPLRDRLADIREILDAPRGPLKVTIRRLSQ
jgi:hypothetical protein